MKRSIVFFWLILLLGLVVRLYNLNSLPVSLHVDEASIGYNAYTILHTGKDEHGVTMPVFFKAFGEYKSPVQIYSTVPFVLLFGLNEFSVRLTSVVYGVFGLIAIYLLVKELFHKQKDVTLFAAFSMLFLAISPWDIHFSRIAWEMMPFVFFTTFGLYLFLRAQRNGKLLPFAVLSFMLAFYSYYAARLFIPLFLLGLFILYFKYFTAHVRTTAISILLLFILLIPFFSNIDTPAGINRWNDVNIFKYAATTQTAYHNIILNYLEHFSLDFLFLKGDSGMPGQLSTLDSVKGVGELYLFQLPLLICGIVYFWKRRLWWAGSILLIWLLLYPTGSMFATGINPLARRSIIGVIPFQIISAIGIVYFLRVLYKLKKTGIILISLSIAVIFLSFGYYLFLYFTQYPKYSAGYNGFQYGSKQIVQYFVAHKYIYDDLIMSQYIFSPYIYYDFYTLKTCLNCTDGIPESMYANNRKQLYALPPYYIATHQQYRYSPVEAIRYPNGTKAFILTEVQKK
jgi:4-amino-4-deoxy-L-arabinose transferase-like glycosyltransferase